MGGRGRASAAGAPAIAHPGGCGVRCAAGRADLDFHRMLRAAAGGFQAEVRRRQELGASRHGVRAGRLVAGAGGAIRRGAASGGQAGCRLAVRRRGLACAAVVLRCAPCGRWPHWRDGTMRNHFTGLMSRRRTRACWQCCRMVGGGKAMGNLSPAGHKKAVHRTAAGAPYPPSAAGGFPVALIRASVRPPSGRA